MAVNGLPGLDLSGSMGGFSNTPTSGQSAQPQNFSYDKLASQGQVFGPVNPSSGFSQPAANPQVLGASTQNLQTFGPTQPSSGGGGGNPNELQQLQAIGGQRNPVQQARFQQLQGQQNPQAPDTSAFDAIINPVISNFEQLVGQQQTATGNVISGMNTQRQTELDTQNQADTQQTQGLQSQQQQTTTSANNAIEEAKRMYAEMSQGIAARYGQTTGTGAFLNEQLGQQTGRNIAVLQQGLAQHMQDIGTALNNVKTVGQLAIRGINERADQQIQTEQDSLQKYIIQIRGNEAMLQSNKAQMAVQAIQKYQDTVNNLNAQREQQANQYAIATLNAQTQLQVYGQKGQAMLSQIQQQQPNFSGIGNNLTYGAGSITNNQPVAPTTTQDRGSLLGAQPNNTQNIFNPQGGQGGQ